MAFSEKLGRGSLGKSRKQSKPGAPEYFGSLTIETPIAAGEKVWLAGWIKQNDSGEKFFSLVVERPQQQGNTAPPRQQSSSQGYLPKGNDMEDDIPFFPEFR